MSSASARWVLCWAAVAAASSACSSSTKSRQPGALEDGGLDASPVTRDSGSGKGGQGGKGGAGGMGGSGGTAGAGGSGTGGLDASADVSVPVEAGHEAGPPAFVCNSPSIPDGSIVPEAGPFSGEWRDFATKKCVACPGKRVECGDFPQGASNYDPTTKVLTMVLAPGVSEVVRGEVTFYWNAIYPDAGYGYGGTEPLPVVVNGNTLTVELRTILPDDVYAIQSVQLTTQDACGVLSTVQFGSLMENGDAQKPGLNLHCEI